jgi:hypothetical protein
VHVSAATPDITIGGSPTAGQLCMARVYRLPSHGNDTKGEDAKLLAIILTYTGK